MEAHEGWSCVLVSLLICHFLADFCLTTKSMIRAKSNGREAIPILLHACVHAILLTTVLLFYGVSLSGCITAFLLELGTHFVIDFLKATATVHIPSLQDITRKPYWVVFGFDQLLHLLVIVVIVATTI